jgi:hypothetical protein
MGAGKTADMTETQKRNVARVKAMAFAKIYPALLAKAEGKGRTKAEFHQVIEWLTGYDEKAIGQALKDERSFEDFFARAPAMNPQRSLITGTICGVRLEEIDDPLMLDIRYLDKLVDELAKGRPLEKILRN